MRKILFGFVFIAPAAFGADLYIDAASFGACVGDTIQIQNHMYRLHADTKCKLPIVNANHMRAMQYVLPGTDRQPEGLSRSGCWAETLSGEAFIIYSDGGTDSHPMLFLNRAKTNNNGELKVVESLRQESGKLYCGPRKN